MNDKIKELRQRCNNAQMEANITKANMVAIQRDYIAKKKLAEQLERELTLLIKLSNAPLVSDHALIRYMERVLGVDFENIKRDIVSEDVMKILNIVGASGKIPHKDGYILVIKDGTIVTILKD